MGCNDGCSDCCVTCPQCSTSCKTCKLKVEEGEESKSCWKVECKEICVPRIVWPWQKTCCNPHANNGACVKTVKVLVKHSYKCPTCEYSWSPEDGCSGDGCCSDGGCNGCASAGCDGCAAASAWSGSWDAGEMPVEAPAQPAAPAPAEGAPVPEVPEAPSATTSMLPLFNGPTPYQSTSADVKSSSKTSALPVRFLRAAKARAAR